MNVPDNYNTNADYDESSAPVAQITSLADNFLRKGYEQFQFASKTFELDKYSNEIGLGPISKQLTMDRLKTILAGYAMMKIVTSLKSNMAKVGIVGGVAFFAFQNKESIMSLFSKSEYINRNLPPSDPVATPQIMTDSMAGMRNKALGDF